MKVITLTYNKAMVAIEQLIAQTDFRPDIVVGVLNGGKTIFDQYKKSPQFNQAHFVEVKLQRQSTKVKKNKWVKTLLRAMPYWLSNRLRVIESNKVRAKINSINKADLSTTAFLLDHLPTIDARKILIVDDAIDSGKTMYVLYQQLQKKYPNAELKSAVLAWTIPTSIVQPNYYLYKNTLLRYPWSKDFKP